MIRFLLTLAILAGAVGSGEAQCAFPLDFSGTEYADCMVDVLHGGDISSGFDVGQQIAGLPAHTAVNIVSPAAGPWATVYAPQTYGDVTVCADGLSKGNNGQLAYGVMALHGGGKALTARSANAGNTDTLYLSILADTGVFTPVASVSLNGAINTHAQHGNCFCRTDGCHNYCQWVRTCLTVAGDTVTATSWLRGEGPLTDPSRNDPDSPLLTLIGTVTAPRPAGLVSVGDIGIVVSEAQAATFVSVTGLIVEP